MHIKDFCTLMDEIAPPDLAFGGDNVGLLVGTDRSEIKTVLVALDCTKDVLAEAVEKGADLILTHHPILWNPARRLSPDDSETAIPYGLMRHGIALFAAHTNLDAAKGGVNDCLAQLLGLQNIRPLPPENLGRMGELPQELRLGEFLTLCGKRLNTAPRYQGDKEACIRTVALIGGGGGGDVLHAAAAGAQAYLTGDVKHSDALTAQNVGIALVAAGHYETESVVLRPLAKRLQKAANDVQYIVTATEKPALMCC